MNESDQTQHNNPAASARRRLLLAIGGGAGVATLHKLSATGWIKPVVNTALLPVHAGGSGRTPLNCPVTICASATQANSLNFTFALAIADISTLTAVTTSGSVSLCTTANLLTGTAFYAARVVSAVDSISGAVTVSCCYTSGTDFGSGVAGAFQIGVNFTGADDGQCTLTPDV